MDLHTLENAQGETFYFDNNSAQYFLTYGNYGMPPVTYQTRKGYKQAGATEIDFTLEPRIIVIQMYAPKKPTRIEYYQERQRFLDFMRPNRGEMTLTLILADNTRRAIHVRPDPGMIFPPKPNTVADWQIEEEVTFQAFDPLWFDPVQAEGVFVANEDPQLAFPIAFPIHFSGYYFEGSITYTGTWKSYPVITVTGPYSSVDILHITTGARIILNVPIDAGEVRIINLKPGAQTVTDANGDDYFSDLHPDSELINFALFTSGEVADGINVIRATAEGGLAGQTDFSLSYYTRYIGI